MFGDFQEYFLLQWIYKLYWCGILDCADSYHLKISHGLDFIFFLFYHRE